MKSIYIRGGDAKEPGVLVLKEHLENKGYKVVRAKTQEYDVVVCWGCSMRDQYIKKVPALNGNVNLYNKCTALKRFNLNGCTIPSLVETYDKDMKYRVGQWGPWFGRNLSHEKGRDITVFQTYEEVLKDRSKDFYTLYVPHIKELRVWTFKGEAFAVYHKQYRNPGIDNYKNMEYRSELREDLLRNQSLMYSAVKATEALLLDFGAVDILEGTDGKYYVLEVNSMPDISSLERVSGIRLANLVSKWTEAQ